MTTKFNVPTRSEVNASNAEIFDNLNKNLGFVPNLYAAMAHSEHGLGRYLNFQGAKTSLSNKEKEAINLVVSQVNNCRYCQSAHTVLGKMNGFDDEEVVRLRRGESTDAKLNSLAKLTKDITENKGRVDEANLNAFYAQGYNHGHLVDTILQVSDKIAMNYLHNLTQIDIDFPLAKEL
ncbi:carboxymuconolactone decarboxylase family protein [Phaeocystidibacter marisrubri]|uniref:Carboxymuconolactone decarboxylase family protein n=1 Tax=Phaeocystidibacter marisrubri TaxID=1577780 RepID=A0A6L3ZEU3_9FLAO|nr:carboxymuconolactone decarboxylase family protein [Phaeocystidibacter marisrubri]KAB2816341.1 carboxymuconolactone decarboxylase family protein [Phaeocystidibacter marisrubri]GGH68542.1 alkyl hydroperoxide reductase AhpD [Phaeocystidibacter marisrubri]